MIRVCFHGAESTGKSVLARKLGGLLGCPVVAEYGRTYAERRGTDFTMDDLLAIGREQNRLIGQAEAARPPWLILDTDPLMTAAWAEMLFGEVPEELLGYPKANGYLLFRHDVPWIEDGTRLFGAPAERTRFAEIARDVLLRARVPFHEIGGDWAARERDALAAIEGVISAVR